ncbi:MAG: hypothetical protein OER95_17790 [Acidimicrobiia bacterium]|nr:hypothetical protein [Acidimicrobiia bacterium]
MGSGNKLRAPAIEAVRALTLRQWLAAGLGAAAVAVLVGVPTDVIPNPVFGRPVDVTWWSYPVLAVTGLLGGLLIATYVRPVAAGPDHDGPGHADADADLLEPEAERAATTGGLAGLLSFFAVGCPVCNKLVLLAVGTTGARQWFEPFQPVLAVLSLALLAYALWFRLASIKACPLPARRTAV